MEGDHTLALRFYMEEIMVEYNLNGIKFFMKEEYNFSWLTKIGKVFAVFPQNDSGNISFGVDNSKEKFFIKVAGLKTAESVRTKEDAIASLIQAMPIYENIKHSNLISLVKHYYIHDIYIAIFKWVEGDCLFDYWNFEKYQNNPQIIPPSERFRKLPIAERIKSANVLFSFLDTVAKSGYVAVDFYDGSIMYDFNTNTTTICDIDFFRKKPTFNDMGENYFGTKRLKAPEEYILGATIDEATNVYTLGALLFSSFFGNYTDDEIQIRYQKNQFEPCSLENWDLSEACYKVVLKATSLDKSYRYATISEFQSAWNTALLTK